jgi:hypothetical protein
MKLPAQARGAVVHTDRAIRLRDRAEECRVLARIIPAEAITLKITTLLPSKRSGLRAMLPN